MIYVIGIGTFADDESYELTRAIKIGYASDFRKRFSSYKAENPKPRVLFKIEGGNLHDEKRLHKYFKRFLFAGREWFTWEEEILEFLERMILLRK